MTIRQTEQHTQFQHYRAALRAMETELRRRWGIRSDESCNRSVWVIFGDDDDLWHHHRVAEYARAIQKHPQIESIAVLATLTRAGVGLFQGQTHVPEQALPRKADEVDKFLRTDYPKMYAGSDHANEFECQDWQKTIRKEDGSSTDRPPPESLFMEHFDYSPRLRVLHEFFNTTAEEIFAHRFCDLRLCEFLETYPRFGTEFGMRLHIFTPNQGWMYFYSNAGMDPGEVVQTCYGTEVNDQELPEVLFAHVEHVSAEVPVTDAEVSLAEKHWNKFRIHDGLMTTRALTKYFAAFRGSMEHFLVRLHTRVIDQRRFDGLIVTCAMSTFGSFSKMCADEGGTTLACKAGQILLRVCQDFAKAIALVCGVSIIWRDHGAVLVPPCRIVSETVTTLGKGIGKGVLPISQPGSIESHKFSMVQNSGGKGLSKGKGFLFDAHGYQNGDALDISSPELDVVETTVQYKFCIPGTCIA